MVNGISLTIPSDIGALYWGEGYTLQEIADEYDTTVQQVQRWFDIKNISRREGYCKYYVPFGGDIDDAITLLNQRDDLFIRCVVHGGAEAYNLYIQDGEMMVGSSSRDDVVSGDREYVSSLIESYDTRLCYKDDYTLNCGDDNE